MEIVGLGKQAIMGRRNSVFLRMLSFSGMLMVFNPTAHDWTKKVFTHHIQQKMGTDGKQNCLGLGIAFEAFPIETHFLQNTFLLMTKQWLIFVCLKPMTNMLKLRTIQIDADRKSKLTKGTYYQLRQKFKTFSVSFTKRNTFGN